MTGGNQRPAGRPAAFYGWRVAGAVTAIAFAQVVFFNPVLGVFFTPLQEEFGWSRGAIAGALSAGTLLGAALTPLVGPRIDRYGGRWFIVAAFVAIGIALALLATIQDLWQFYALYIVGRGLVTCVIGVAISVTISNWFIRNRGRANAFQLIGTRLGMALLPPFVLLFLNASGWRAAFVGLGVLAVTIGIAPAWIWIKRRPEDLGLFPDGDPAPPRASAVPGAVSDVRWTVGAAVRTRAFWLLLIGTSQLMLVGGATNLSMAPHIEDNGLGRDTAVTVITVWAFSGIVGGVIGGELRQRIPARFALAVTLAFSGIGILWLIFVDSVWMAFAFAVFHGTAFGAQLPINESIFPDYFGRWTVGAIRGVTAPLQFGMNALGPLVANLAFDRTGSYDGIFAVFVGLMFVGALLILLAAPPAPPTPRQHPLPEAG